MRAAATTPQAMPRTPASAPALLELAREADTRRILFWLERYPFQSAQDLVVALAPWHARTAVYARLAALEHRHLIETLHAGCAPGKRLYHLSPAGQYVYDQLAVQQGQTERAARWDQRSRAQVIRDERERLLYLLPRLPVWGILQALVNGLVLHAATALARQGRAARVVQWNWLRDYRHPFVSSQDTLRVQVEGALTLGMRFPLADSLPSAEGDRSAMSAPSWYTMLLLHCPLDEIRLIRTRLDRLLRWRESAERSSVYSQMPPLLVLATTERQAEWWHQAAHQVAARLRVHHPLGVLTCLANASQAHPLANGWQLAWQRLGTKEACHLQDVLHPTPTPAVPELRTAQAPLAHLAGSTMRGRQQKTEPGTPAAPLPLVPPVGPRSGPFALAACRDEQAATLSFSPRHWELLRLCFAHPFLSREDLAALLSLSPTTVRLLLTSLARRGILTRVDTPVGERWQTTETGLRVLSRLALCHVHRLVRFPLPAQAPFEQRGAPGLLKQIQHTAGVYGFFARLARELATELGTHEQARLRWWETGVISERHFRFREQTYRFRPDALASVQYGERTFRFWLEWDRGTMTPKDLQIKFTTYRMYLLSREWASTSPVLPLLLCVAPHGGQEQRLAEAAQRCLGPVPIPGAFRLYTTSVGLLATQGILAPIWRAVPLVPLSHHAQDGTPRAPPAFPPASPEARSHTPQRIAVFAEQPPDDA